MPAAAGAAGRASHDIDARERDARLENRVSTAYALNPHLGASDVDAMVRDGKVTLTGTADSVAARALAGRVAAHAVGVETVDNQLRVNSLPPSRADTARSSARSIARDIADSWINVKVELALLYSARIDGTHITVSTSDGVVTLRGRVASGAERSMAIDLASNVRGVNGVHAQGCAIIR